jgi:branched-chain amino acid transport system ATP-binding protein
MRGLVDVARRPFGSNGLVRQGGGRLLCRGVDVAYEGVQVLFGVDVVVEAGEMVALLGTNGAGKSTLLRAVSGLVEPIAGAIEFDGVDITNAGAVRTSHMGIVLLPGGRAVFPTLTVGEHFRAAGWLQRGDMDNRDRIERAVERFPRIKERWGQLAGNLSGGEQQQLALAMAFTADPRLLIIDELTLGLSPIIVEQLLEMVRAINASGCTVLIVEQSVNTALNLAHRAYFMEKGEVRFSGPTADLLERRDILRSVFLEGAASVGGTNVAPAATPRAAHTAGDAVSPATTDGEPPLRIAGIGKSFGGIRAVTDVSFDVRQKEILGLIGPNGAGKTTIFDLISGLLKPDSGQIRLRGKPITRWSPDRRARWGLGRSFQDARLFSSLTVAECLAIGLERHVETRDHLAALLALPAIQHSEENVAYAVDDLVELMELGAYRDKFIGELSTGSRRIVDLAMAIAHEPDVLLLDEPSSGIAQRETEALAPLLRRIQKETGCAMLVIEHDMPLITSVSDRLLALDLGEIIAVGAPRDVINDPKVVTSYLGGEIHARGGV